MTTALLHERFGALRESLPYIRLGTGPTPLQPLPPLADGRAQIWLKDDGRYGDGGWGGNKVRKLEWLIPDAQRKGRRTILTVGGLATNWGLAAAVYGREHGLDTALALVDQPIDDHVLAQLERLEHSGATLHFTHTTARTVMAVPYLLARHSAGGRPPYFLPAGGSSTVGVLGYVEAALELAGQVAAGVMPEPTHVVTPIGSGGTTAGLLLGFELAGLSTRVVGVVVNDKLRLDSTTLLRSARRAAALLRARGARLPRLDLAAERLLLVRDQLGDGYGYPTDSGRDARQLAAERAGLALEPVYTAKAMAATLALDAAGRLGDGPVVFLNTNGPR